MDVSIVEPRPSVAERELNIHFNVFVHLLIQENESVSAVGINYTCHTHISSAHVQRSYSRSLYYVAECISLYMLLFIH